MSTRGHQEYVFAASNQAWLLEQLIMRDLHVLSTWNASHDVINRHGDEQKLSLQHQHAANILLKTCGFDIAQNTMKESKEMGGAHPVWPLFSAVRGLKV